MVRLVFRPYTQVLQTICTSVLKRASTRISPGFTLLKYSSPSFWSMDKNSSAVEQQKIRNKILIPYVNNCHQSRTCTCLRLLGPCFKTGGTSHLLYTTILRRIACNTSPWKSMCSSTRRSLNTITVSDTFNPPFEVLFRFPSQYFCTIGSLLICSVLRWIPHFDHLYYSGLLDFIERRLYQVLWGFHPQWYVVQNKRPDL